MMSNKADVKNTTYGETADTAPASDGEMLAYDEVESDSVDRNKVAEK